MEMTMRTKRDDSGWIQSYTGRQLWPLDSSPEDYCIEDIAHSLSCQCRYLGHTREPYSIAQHSVLVSHVVPSEHALWGLLHDAAESLIGDWPRPLKRSMYGDLDRITGEGFVSLKLIEHRILFDIATAFNLPWPMPSKEIEQADLLMLATEQRDLMATPPRPWISTENVMPLAERIIPLAWRESEAMFLARFAELRVAADVSTLRSADRVGMGE